MLAKNLLPGDVIKYGGVEFTVLYNDHGIIMFWNNGATKNAVASIKHEILDKEGFTLIKPLTQLQKQAIEILESIGYKCTR